MIDDSREGNQRRTASQLYRLLSRYNVCFTLGRIGWERGDCKYLDNSKGKIASAKHDQQDGNQARKYLLYLSLKKLG